MKAYIRYTKPRQPKRRNVTARIALVILVGGCASANTAKVQVVTSPNSDVLGFGRVLVAGFLPNGVDQINLNDETARFLRMQLRSRASLQVIESAPLELAELSPANGQRSQMLGVNIQRSDRNLTAHARTGREPALSIHFRLMDQMMPSILGALGQQTTQTRVLLK